MAEYIERESLIKYAEKQEVIIKNGLSVADAMRIQGNVFRRCAETCPAADVAPVRHGHWVKEKSDVLIHWHCSACEKCYFIEEPNADYCPRCGAKMDGKDE